MPDLLPSHVLEGFAKFAKPLEDAAYERGLKDGEASVVRGMKALSAFLPAGPLFATQVAQSDCASPAPVPAFLSHPAAPQPDAPEGDDGGFDLDALMGEIQSADPQVRQLVLALAMAAVQEALTAQGQDPAPVLAKLKAMAEAGGVEAATDPDSQVWMGWQAGQSKRSGKPIAVGTEEHQGKTLYGKQAEAALRAQENRGHRTEARGRRDELVGKLEQGGAFTADDWDGFAGHLPHLTGAELKDLRGKIKTALMDKAHRGIVKAGKNKSLRVENLAGGVKKLIAHAMQRPDMPDATPSADSGHLTHLLPAFGGLDPDDPHFKGHLGSAKDAAENYGLPRNALKKGGKSLTQMARALANEGHLNIPEGENEENALVEQLTGGGRSPAFMENDHHARAEHQRRDQLAESLQKAHAGQGATQPAPAAEPEYPPAWDDAPAPQGEGQTAPHAEPKAEPQPAGDLHGRATAALGVADPDERFMAAHQLFGEALGGDHGAGAQADAAGHLKANMHDPHRAESFARKLTAPGHEHPPEPQAADTTPARAEEKGDEYASELDLEDAAGAAKSRNADDYLNRTMGLGKALADAGADPNGDPHTTRATSQEAGALHEYRSKTNRTVAKKLRAGEPLSPDEQRQFDAVNGLANRMAVPQAMKLHRVVGSDVVAGLKPGDTFRDPAPMFTGVREGDVNNIRVGGEQKKLTILADKGSHAAHVSGGEGPEVILPANAPLEVVSVSPSGVVLRHRAAEPQSEPQPEPAKPAEPAAPAGKSLDELRQELRAKRGAGGETDAERRKRVEEKLFAPKPVPTADEMAGLSEQEQEKKTRAALDARDGAGADADDPLAQAMAKADADPDGTGGADAPDEKPGREAELKRSARKLAALADHTKAVHAEVVNRLKAGKPVTVEDEGGNRVRLGKGDAARLQIDQTSGELQLKNAAGEWEPLSSDTIDQLGDSFGLTKPDAADPKYDDAEGIAPAADHEKTGRKTNKDKAGLTAPLREALDRDARDAMDAHIKAHRGGPIAPPEKVVKYLGKDDPRLKDYEKAFTARKGELDAEGAERHARESAAEDAVRGLAGGGGADAAVAAEHLGELPHAKLKALAKEFGLPPTGSAAALREKLGKHLARAGGAVGLRGDGDAGAGTPEEPAKPPPPQPTPPADAGAVEQRPAEVTPAAAEVNRLADTITHITDRHPLAAGDHITRLRAVRPEIEALSKAQVDALSRRLGFTPEASKKATVDTILRNHETQVMSRMKVADILGHDRGAEPPPVVPAMPPTTEAKATPPAKPARTPEQEAELAKLIGEQKADRQAKKVKRETVPAADEPKG